MIPECALLCLELPSSALMVETVQPLTVATKQYLASRYKDTTKFQEEAMALPLVKIEAVCPVMIYRLRQRMQCMILCRSGPGLNTQN